MIRIKSSVYVDKIIAFQFPERETARCTIVLQSGIFTPFTPESWGEVIPIEHINGSQE